MVSEYAVILTDNEKAYLQLAYDKGYRYVATMRYGGTYFYSGKVKKYSEYNVWSEQCSYKYTRSLCDYGTKWKDEEPVKIADLLGIDDTDWSKVNPYTPVWVRDSEDEEWEKAYFLEYLEYIDDERNRFCSACFGKRADDCSFASWKYCRLATQEEIDEVIGGK